MYIQTETTPNPDSLKFIPGITVINGAPLHFTTADQATISPLAHKLLQIEEVKGVFLGQDFITVTKASEVEWDVLQPVVLSAIMDHIVSGFPIVAEDTSEATPTDYVTDASEDVVNQIIEIIESHIRPAVAQDGGDIIFHGFMGGVVQVKLHGACSGCPSSTITLKNGIENMLKYYVPEVQAVEAV